MISIPFNDWSKERIKAGQKCATSRYKRYGKPGDTFMVDGETYELTHVVKRRLGIVAYYYFEEEGAKNPQEFIQIWEEIHPKRGFIPDDIVWYHAFRKVEE